MGAIKTPTERAGASFPQISTHNGIGATRLGMVDMIAGTTTCCTATIVVRTDGSFGDGIILWLLARNVNKILCDLSENGRWMHGHGG
jgi:hypothetical protein